MVYILKELVANLAIMIAGFYLAGKIIKEPIGRQSGRWDRCLMSVLAAGIGLVLMFFSIEVGDNIMIDLRHIPIIILAYYAGFVPTMVSAALIGISRLLFGFDETSLFALMTTLIFGLIVGVASRFISLGTTKKISVLNIISLLIISTHLYVVMGGDREYWEVLIYYWFIAVPAGVFAAVFFQDIQYSKRMFQQLKNDSKTDFLTGLSNVRHFHFTLNDLFKKSGNQVKGVSLLLMDLDHFKRVNDTYGHDAGDAVLKQLGGLLQANARPTDQIARNGGEEFSVLLPDCSRKDSLEIAERIRAAVERHRFVLPEGDEIKLSISIGVSQLEKEMKKPDDLYKNADKALYKAKTTGRNRVVY
ncbi:UNVERIFIED_CONTAM: diguanylate cyclase [Halobacillus marinus]|nr:MULTISPECIES: diguanylate cyclase [unclassified Halobacillus]ELK44659.1 diguanylate cyclase [Halobacillus sp. BAB-2008]